MFQGFKPRQDLVGFTAIPNEWFDEVMGKIDNLAELKVVQAVFRKTYGWVEGWAEDKAVYKLEDAISYSQFEEMTGLSSASISEGLKRAIAHGYIIQVSAGDFETRESARYRIRTISDNPQTLEERPQTRGVGKFLPTLETKAEEGVLPTLETKAESTLETKAREPLETKAELTLETKVTKERKEKEKKRKESDFDFPKIEKEVYSTKDVKSRGSTMFARYKDKEISEYNANDLAFYFREKYENITGVRYSRITNKERGHLKELLDTFGAEVVAKGIDYLMENYHTLISGYPSIAVLYGFRTSIIPSAVKGNPTSRLDVRESKLTEEDIQEQGKEGNVIKW